MDRDPAEGGATHMSGNRDIDIDMDIDIDIDIYKDIDIVTC